VLRPIREPKAQRIILRLVFLLSVVGGVLENANVFVSQEDLTLSMWAPRFGIRISVSKFVASFNIDLSPLGDGTEEGVRGGAKREDGMP